MPSYLLHCQNCGPREVVARMKDAAWFMPCPGCERPRPQVITAPQFQQDNLRLWRGPMGNGWSSALGAPMPDSRAERDRMAKERGVEFITKDELMRSNPEARDAIEYRAHVDSGGARTETPAPPADAWKEPQ